MLRSHKNDSTIAQQPDEKPVFLYSSRKDMKPLKFEPTAPC